MRCYLRVLLVLWFAVASVSVGYAMEPVSDEQLGEISGAEGVQLTLRLRNNVDANFAPLGCSGTLNNCRMGLEFSGREGIWLMLKDYYGYLEINDVRLESSILPATSTSFADSTRFLSLDGTSCLIPGKSVAQCLPTSLRAVKVGYPNNKGPGEYNDLNLLVNIGRTALEFDDAGSGTPGYMRDVATGSVLGFRMADSTELNAPSRSRFNGTAYVFGF